MVFGLHMVSTRYAKALILSASDEKQKQKLFEDLLIAKKALDESEDCRNFFKSPVIKGYQKKIIVDEIFKGQVSDLLYEFILLVIKSNRTFLVESIFQIAIEKLKEEKGIISLNITFAYEVDKETLGKIEKKLSAQLKKTVDLEVSKDESLIGGFTIETKDKILDLSILGKLNTIKRTLLSNI